jgi:organic radical activating enzyme
MNHDHWNKETSVIQNDFLVENGIDTKKITAVSCDFSLLDPKIFITNDKEKYFIFYDIHDSTEYPSFLQKFLDQWLSLTKNAVVVIHDISPIDANYVMEPSGDPLCPRTRDIHFSGQHYGGYKECETLIKWLNKHKKNIKSVPATSIVYFDTCPKNTEVVLCMRCQCNYSCDYCIGNRNKDTVELHDLDKLSKIYQATEPYIVTLFECKSGEPTLHPQIKEILSLCTSYGTVSMPTNNSLKPSKWLSKDYAKSILLNVTLHPQAETNLDAFLDHLIEIRELGSTIGLRYIGRPDKMKNIPKLKEFFKKNNFDIAGIPFIGDYENKTYPQGYTDEEKKFLGIDGDIYWVDRLSMDMKSKDFYGIPCLAGSSFFCLSPKTVLTKCLYDSTPIDGPFNEIQPCKVHRCGCSLMLKELNTQSPEQWNYLRGLSGYPLLEYTHESNDELYQKAVIIYQDLMKRYKKT